MPQAAAAKTIKLTIACHLEDIFLIGLATQAFCTYAPFSEVEAYQVQLAIEEAVANSIEHAYGTQQPEAEVELWVSFYLDRVVFQVRDRGLTMPGLPRKELEFDPSDRQSLPEGGMGLYIIQSVMDEVNYSSTQGVNDLTMVKFFKNPPAS